MLSLESGKLLSGDWWSPVASGRSKRSTGSTRWGWIPLSEWPCMQTGSQPELNTPMVDIQYVDLVPDHQVLLCIVGFPGGATRSSNA